MSVGTLCCRAILAVRGRPLGTLSKGTVELQDGCRLAYQQYNRPEATVQHTIGELSSEFDKLKVDTLRPGVLLSH